jgi:hypothetical protein
MVSAFPFLPEKYSVFSAPTAQGRIGVCFEEKNLYLELAAKENLEFFARLFGIRRFDAMEVHERVGLADRAKERVKTYFKGMSLSQYTGPEVLETAVREKKIAIGLSFPDDFISRLRSGDQVRVKVL